MFVLLLAKHEVCCFSFAIIEIYLIVYCSEDILGQTVVVTGKHTVTVKVKNTILILKKIIVKQAY